MSDRADDKQDGDHFRCDFCGIFYHADETAVTDTADGHQTCGYCRDTEADWGGDHIADTQREDELIQRANMPGRGD